MNCVIMDLINNSNTPSFPGKIVTIEFKHLKLILFELLDSLRYLALSKYKQNYVGLIVDFTPS